MFRNRQNGKITIVQLPNAPLAVYFVLAIATKLIHTTGNVRTGLDLASAAALTVWALGEVVRGVNPFRRGLGVLVLVAELVAFIMR